MQFVVTAWDGTDEEALSRRRAVRPTHLERIVPLVEAGHILVGGAILDPEGEIGSVLLVDFDTREELDAWVAKDPYTTGDVWRSVDVRPFRAAMGSWLPEA